MSENKLDGMMSEDTKELRSLGSSPTWSVASVLSVFVVVSLLVERSIHQLGNWLKKTNRKPLQAALEKMKEELMLLGFISLLLTATSSIISNICIPSKLYGSVFVPCTDVEADEAWENNSSKERKLLIALKDLHSYRRMLKGLNRNTCPENYEPFVSHEGLEQLHRFIFVMAVTHISYSCLTMLLAIVKIHSWRIWEDEAQINRPNSMHEVTKALTLQRQSTFVRVHVSNPTDRSRFFVWMTCFLRQFGHSVVRVDYLTLRQGFITNHNLTPKYDFHSYMIRSMEEEFQSIVGVSAPLWGFVVSFMLFNVKGSNLYFWIALIPFALVLLVGTKLQHVIATLALESVGIRGNYGGSSFKLRDELFWFNKPELLLSLIHFILFQNAFELASFFWFWWQFGYHSCFIKNHFLVYLRLILGFTGQFLCSYSTLPLYALVTQMGSNYKAALIPPSIRETIHGWNKAAKRRRKLGGGFADDSTVHTDTSTVISIDEFDNQLPGTPRFTNVSAEIEMQVPNAFAYEDQSRFANGKSSRVGMPLLRPSASISSPDSGRVSPGIVQRSSSMPR
ncbi:MLO-like protein 11 [Striga hermonthica]|uniref:MLO-like protein n=1 Tax=Striga hermonthica TaxID=68872 RepID=A0A9N7R2P9_STRHE|nr:MLO-like protein 11 [Striga hermonthica]